MKKTLTVTVEVEIPDDGVAPTNVLSVWARRGTDSAATLVADEGQRIDDAKIRSAVLVFLRSAARLVQGNDLPAHGDTEDN